MSQKFGPYNVGETIGHGTFGKVKVAIHEMTHAKVALKIIPRRVFKANANSSNKIMREIKILRLLRHPNIMKLYDVVQTRHDVVLVLEHVSGVELFDFICSRGLLPENMARHIYQQIVAAVAYCHRHRVVHRDLKPENIMFDPSTSTVKVGDFGLSSVTHDGFFLETSCGTPNYASPEVVSGQVYAGPETDVWSCGVLLYVMLTGSFPFDDESITVLFRNIKSANYTVPVDISEDARDLLRRMLVVNPLERATIEQVMQHPWVSPKFPESLLSLHCNTILDSQRFGKVLLLHDVELDASVIADVAARFGVSQKEVASIVAEHVKNMSSAFEVFLMDGSVDDICYPALDFYKKYGSVLDFKHWPTPLVIPEADVVLRDKRHDVYVSYLILEQLKHRHLPLSYRSRDRKQTRVAHSLMLSMTANKGYGSLNANSLNSASLDVSTFSRGAMISHGTESVLGNRRRGGQAFYGSLPVCETSEQHESETSDTYMDTYNQVVVSSLPLYAPRSNHTLLGKLLGVPENPVAWKVDTIPTFPSPSPSINRAMDSSATPFLKPKACEAKKSPPPMLCGKKLLFPRSLRPEKSQQHHTYRDPCLNLVENISFSSVQSADDLHHEPMTRIGNNFIHNGVLFAQQPVETTLRCVYSALREEGLMWKTIKPFYLAAIMHPSVKLQLKVYRTDAQKHIINVKVSTQSGMFGFVVATRLLERLRKKAEIFYLCS
ncbi:protein kinase [Trypanosoma vivax]|nr:protein kinase [Trypanosoma vivax]